jgi:hypothetical protein
MPRTINATTQSQLESDAIRFANLLEIGFSPVIYLTDYTHDIPYGGNTFEASSHLLSIADPQETRELRVGAISVEMSGVSQEYISIFLNQNWVNRSVKLYKAVVSGSDGSIIGDPILIFNGLLSQFQIEDSDNSSVITIQVASHWADFQRKTGRYTNDQSQQYYFSGDLGMQFSANTVKDIKWGRS